MSTGKLLISVTDTSGYLPLNDATIEISNTGEPDRVIESLNTNNNGQSEQVELESPPVEYSLEPGSNQPYSEYNLKITAPGFDSLVVSGVQILEGQLGIQNIILNKGNQPNPYDPVVIGAHTLYGYYPPKIAESEIKPVDETGEIVLSRVVIPEYVVVHDGSPSDSTAKDYYILYKDYIKNVASCEIYSTWPEATIQANVLAIMSFTLNRVFTEWYRNKGYNFTISSSTAYDHKWIYGKTIYESISEVVDSIFSNYLSRPNVIQPILTQYCDGKRVSCPNWMSQWGSKSLGDDGYDPIEILRYYYGNNMFINTAEAISGIPSSWPGYDLTIGASGEKVSQLQSQLNTIAKNYPLIPVVNVDGVYGSNTANAVRVFQGIFNLPQTGVVDFATWYKISEIYVGVSKIAELI